MARAKRNKPHRSARVHDRRSKDLPRNAEVAAVEVDDPLGLEPGEKIVTLRSLRNDPLGKLHSRRQIDEAQFQGGRAFQDDWEKAERGPQAVDPTREYVDGGQAREPITERQRKAVLRLNRAERELGADGSALARMKRENASRSRRVPPRAIAAPPSGPARADADHSHPHSHQSLLQARAAPGDCGQPSEKPAIAVSPDLAAYVARRTS
jgi:hypothetical protein